MRAPDREHAALLEAALKQYDTDVHPLKGIHPAGHLECLVEQLVKSLRRIQYVHHVSHANHDPRRTDPADDLFDPLKAAVIQYRNGNQDEAYWLVFLATHFGKHPKDGWRLCRDVYGRLGGARRWDWNNIKSNPADFRDWVSQNEHSLRGGDGVSRRFSNHRKYESLKADSDNGLPAVIESYIGWICPPRTHQDLIRSTHRHVGQNPRKVFGELYCSMDVVKRFGRLGKFDYLTMLGKLGIAPIEPGSAYLTESTGPIAGARLLFEGNSEITRFDRQLDARLVKLDGHLNVGMQVLEDALCNWQKNPESFMPFRG